jgi:DNA-binding transcriptional LysR family regulator
LLQINKQLRKLLQISTNWHRHATLRTTTTPMSDLKQLEAFVTVAQQGSFVSASHKLGLSKAMVSRRVADLEAALQVRLINRTTRKTALTESGRAYFERCADILLQLDEANAALSANAAQVRGTLRINAPLSFGNLRLAPLWGAFMLQYPLVQLDVVLSDRLVDTVEEGFDLTIRVGQLQASSLVSRQLTTSCMVLCASPKYLKHAAPLLTPKDIAAHRVTVYTGSSNGNTWPFTDSKGLQQPIAVNALPGVRCNSGDTCVAAAVAGYGLSYQPLFLVESALKAGTLKVLLSDYDTPELGIHALYPSRKHLSGKVRAMVDFLSNNFADTKQQMFKK